MISVLILTYNEEANIAGCIESIPWRDDIIVLDSLSTDNTVDIVKRLNAKVVTCAFTNYAEQRNYGLAQPFKNEWILMLDADERVTVELSKEIQAVITQKPSSTMFVVRRQDMFLGRWLKRASGYPTWFPRLFLRGHVRVEREINESYSTDGKVGRLKEHLIHFPFNKGPDWWFDRHNSYSAAEAKLMVYGDSTKSCIWSNDQAERRAGLKRLLYRMPLRPLLIFTYLYVFRLGFLDGRAGFRFATMRLAYEIMIDAKVDVMRKSL